MAVEQINPVRLQPLQTRLTTRKHILWVGSDICRIGRIHEAELGREKDLFALPCAREPFANNIVCVAIDVRAVPVGLAELVGTVEVGEALFVATTVAIGTAEGHEASAESNDLGSTSAELASRKCCYHIDELFVKPSELW